MVGCRDTNIARATAFGESHLSRHIALRLLDGSTAADCTAVSAVSVLLPYSDATLRLKHKKSSNAICSGTRREHLLVLLLSVLHARAEGVTAEITETTRAKHPRIEMYRMPCYTLATPTTRQGGNQTLQQQ